MILKLALLLTLTCGLSFEIKNIEEENFIRCNYYGISSYICTLSINNPNGIEFDVIEGNHAENRTNDDVGIVQGIYQNTRNIPRIICEQFPNLFEIFIELSHLEVLTVESLADCVNLEFLFLSQNSLTIIPERIFVNHPNLDTVALFDNQIAEIYENSFAGSSVKVLELDGNLLSFINPNWFPNSLEILTLSRNLLTEIPKGFNLTNLIILDLSHNNLGHLMPGIFNGLNNLEHLRLTNVSISDIYVGIFKGK